MMSPTATTLASSPSALADAALLFAPDIVLPAVLDLRLVRSAEAS